MKFHFHKKIFLTKKFVGWYRREPNYSVLDNTRWHGLYMLGKNQAIISIGGSKGCQELFPSPQEKFKVIR